MINYLKLITMKKKLIGPLLTAIAFVLLIAMFVYFLVSLNKMDKKMNELSLAVTTNSNQTSAIVNYFNSSLNANQE